jgi:hypothetical protein
MRRRLIKIGLGVVLMGAVSMLASCVSFSPFRISEAALPQDWPELTPVGEIRIQAYPVYRAASVTADQAGSEMEQMFGVLFRHIKDEGIAMTAPVDMGYANGEMAAGPTDMAFLYRSTQQGTLGADGDVQVRDVDPATFVSLGVRGGYEPTRIAPEVEKLMAWLAEHPEWQACGPPRYLGYNSPFVPAFMRYGEVQVPVDGLGGTAEPGNSPGK